MYLGIDHLQLVSLLNHPEINVKYIFTPGRFEITAGEVNRFPFFLEHANRIVNLIELQIPLFVKLFVMNDKHPIGGLGLDLDIIYYRLLDERMRNPFFLDSESGFDWTANPELTGQWFSHFLPAV